MITIHELYVKVYKICQQADRVNKSYIGFRSDKQVGFKLFINRHDRNGRSSYRANLPIADWAGNVVYRLCELGYVDFPVDEVDKYFYQLNDKVGYNELS